MNSFSEVNADLDIILFDVSGVLITQRPNVRTFAEILEIDPADELSIRMIDQALWFHREAHDCGEDDRVFWDSITGDCGLECVTDSVLEKLVHEDTHRLHHPEKFALEVATCLKNNGYRLGICSNTPTTTAHLLQNMPWVQGLFEVFIFSGPLGHSKPSQAFFKEAIVASTVSSPEQILLIDDRAENLRAARHAKLQTLEWTTPQRVSRELVTRGILQSLMVAS